MNIGQFFVDTDKLDSAIIYNKRALSYSETTGWRIFNGIILRSLGLVYLKRNKIDSVKYYYWQSLLASRQQKNSRSEINTSLNLAYLYAKLKRRDSAKYYAKNAFFEAINFKSAEIVKGTSAGLLALLWKEEGNLDSAFVYLTISKTIGDSLSKDWSNKINKFQNVNFEEQLRLEKEAQENLASKNKIRTTALFAGLGLLSILAFVFYRNNRQKQKANLVLQEQKEKVESTLQELKSTQTQLIQSEKMASLGELTAGIAHEIQNPLNFVNNFSELNNELLQELGPLDKLGVTADQQDILKDLQSNSEKINHHGQRAAAIVKGMLQHSRTSSGQKEPTDINALCDEYLRLAYHGLRAKDKNFNAEFKTEFDETIPKVNIVPQDMGRVVLNLINNAFFAVGERGKEEAISHKVEAISSEEKVIPSGLQLTPYSPTVTVSTKNLGNKIEITVSDNGTGIPSEIKEKIFQPFFTTKPTGQGTGLGLSLAYDIVKAHGGEIMVESTTINGLPNRAMGMGGTKFIITLPIS
ncbi:MAG: two-component sensor histidine kinase [Sediminibacterium sp.]|nr:two-component sensor histidine kinase [Sediminibacterium sp.]